MHTVFALLCFVVVIHWLIFPYPSGLLHWHCGNLTIAPVPAKQPWWIWINTSCEFIMNDCVTTTKQSTTKHSFFISIESYSQKIEIGYRSSKNKEQRAYNYLVRLLLCPMCGDDMASSLIKSWYNYDTFTLYVSSKYIAVAELCDIQIPVTTRHQLISKKDWDLSYLALDI